MKVDSLKKIFTAFSVSISLIPLLSGCLTYSLWDHGSADPGQFPVRQIEMLSAGRIGNRHAGRVFLGTAARVAAGMELSLDPVDRDLRYCHISGVSDNPRLL